jgi:hypothetical protein
VQEKNRKEIVLCLKNSYPEPALKLNMIEHAEDE